MNQLTAVVKSIETEDNTSLVIAEAAGISFSALVIDVPAAGLYEGNEVIMVFKETAMSVAKKLSGSLSIRNRFPAVVTEVKMNKVLTSVSLQCNGHTLTSVITTRSAKDLAIAVGDEVEGLVKTNDISLMQKT